MAINEIAVYFLEKGLERTPKFVLSRLLPADKLKGLIDVDLRADNPISVNTAATVPNISLWFEVVNRSSLNLTLEKILLEVWFGQPTFEGAILRPLVIPRSERAKNIRFWQDLSSAQVQQYEWLKGTNQMEITIYLTAYFESKAGTLVLEKPIKRQLRTQGT